MQQALIVDDSKTARLALQKMLDRQHIPVAAVESGEEALEFLKDHHPDIIFMDHMMPGMDGFAAVKAIKADPEKSSIPIVMHTTKQGDIYLGQARALGATAILTKPATDLDLEAVLDRVKRSTGQTLWDMPVAEVIPIDPSIDTSSVAEPATPTMSTSPTIELAARSIDQAVSPRNPEAPSFFGTFRQWAVALIWLLPALWLLSLYLPAEKELAQVKQEQAQLIRALAWAANQQEGYDYGELPMSGQRLTMLMGLVERLSRAGFEGVIRLEGHIGEFCLSQITLDDGSEIAMLPRPEQSIVSCNIIGTSPSRAMRLSVAQSEAFGEYVAGVGLLSKQSPIRLELVPYGASSPHFAYPSDLDGITTGDWNTVALKNNRVNFVIRPD